MAMGAWIAIDGAGAASADEQERVHWDEPGPDGRLRGGVVLVPRPDPPPALAGEPPTFITIHGGGDPEHRLDIVLLGDGYTEAEQSAWAADCAALVAALLAEPPMDRYAPLISVHRMDIVSNESGVDHDPRFGILRDTVLDMRFWCGGVERLLCVNTAKAGLYANFAPGSDLVVAVANTATYGGAGYDGTATTTARHPDAGEVLLHEIGHSLAGLADEYFSDGIFTGPEPSEPNVSTLPALEMAATGTKWAAWLGAPAPAADGPVDGFEGGQGFAQGMFRPTQDSLMRSLHRPFNPPSLEALVLAIHEPIGMIESATPAGTLAGHETLLVQPVPVAGVPLSVHWSVDGRLVGIDGGPVANLELPGVGPPAGSFTVTAEVVDETPLVRDEARRARWMREVRSWTVDRTPCPGDLDGDRTVNGTDLLIVLAAWGCTECVGDVDADGSVGISDLLSLLGVWGPC